MKDIIIALCCGACMALLPNTNQDQQADAGIIRQVERTRTVTTCDENCPVIATVEVPAPVIVEAAPVATKSTSVTRTVRITGSQCCQRAPVRRVVAGVGRVAVAPVMWVNRVRVNRLEARSCRGNRIAGRRVGNRTCRGW